MTAPPWKIKVVEPTHQGPGAEHLLAKILVPPGQLVLSNL